MRDAGGQWCKVVGSHDLFQFARNCPADESIMSLSPASLSNESESVSKRRRANSDAVNRSVEQPPPALPAPSQVAPHIPKRGARACTACRKGKNRCEGEVRTTCRIFRPALLTVARLPPPRPGLRLLVDVVRTMAFRVYMKSRRRSLKFLMARVSSM